MIASGRSLLFHRVCFLLSSERIGAARVDLDITALPNTHPGSCAWGWESPPGRGASPGIPAKRNQAARGWLYAALGDQTRNPFPGKEFAFPRFSAGGTHCREQQTAGLGSRSISISLSSVQGHPGTPDTKISGESAQKKKKKTVSCSH